MPTQLLRNLPLRALMAPTCLDRRRSNGRPALDSQVCSPYAGRIAITPARGPALSTRKFAIDFVTMRLKCSFTVCLFALFAQPVAAATAKPASVGLSEQRLVRIHGTIQRHIDAHDISGAVTLVARKGQIAWFHSQGLMDIDANKPMQKDAMFRVFSMSKPVCGVAILMLLEEGKVRLNDPVSKFIPEFKGSKVAVIQDRPVSAPPSSQLVYYTVPAAREITIQDLLTHVSGLASGGQASSHELGSLIDMVASRTLADMMPKFAAASLDFQPGSRWTYSPLAGFDTLGRVVEVASGMSFDRFLRERIFTPLGMKTTTFHPGDDRWSGVVTAYHRADNSLTKTQGPNRLQSKTYFSGAGGLVSTAEEYAQFALMLAAGGQWNGVRLLSPKTVELMSSVFVPDTLPGRAPGRGYGLSVEVVSDPVAAGRRVSKGSFGWDGAYGTHFWVDPKENLIGVMMIQTDNPDRQVDRDFENAVMQAIVE
jgi:CubicO group peptidase (beta-lactamase class C family)